MCWFDDSEKETQKEIEEDKTNQSLHCCYENIMAYMHDRYIQY